MNTSNLDQTEILAHRYVLRERLGSGAEGAVWRAFDSATGEEVAVKCLESDAASVQELRWLRDLWHPGIVRVRDAVTDADAGVSVLVLDLVSGESLSSWMRGAAAAAVDVVVIRSFEALAYLHERGTVHGDLKPENIIVTRGADGVPQPVLLDFGMATRRRDGEFRGGTPAYFAPEMAAGALPDSSTDVFALGLALLHARVGGERPPRTIPSDLEVSPLVTRVLRRTVTRRERRHSSALEVLAAVRTLDGPGVPALPPRLPLVGRDAMLRRIEAMLGSEAGAVVHVTGHRGSGRARLLDELTVRCRVAARPIARWYTMERAEDFFQRALNELGVDGAPLPAVEDTVVGMGTEDGEAVQWAARVLEAVDDRGLVMAGPWESAVDPDLRAAVVATSRAAKRTGAAIDVVITSSPATTLDLAPSSTEQIAPWSLLDVEALLEAVLPEMRSGRFEMARAVHDATAGHPAAVDMLLRALLKRGSLVSATPDVVVAVAQEIAEFGPPIDQRHAILLATLAAHEVPARPSELSRAGFDAAAINGALTENLVTVHGGRVRPTSTVLARQCYERLSAERRRELHAELASAAEESWEALLHGLRSGARPDLADVLRAVEEAGSRQPRRAMLLAEEALAEGSERRPDALHLAAAELRLRMGLIEQARGDLERLARVGGATEARARSRLADLATLDGDLDRAVELASAAVAAADGGDVAATARLTLAWAYLKAGRLEAALAASREASEGASSPLTRAAALNLMGLSAQRLADEVAARRAFEGALALLGEHGAETAAAGVSINLGRLLMRSGELAEADRRFLAGETVARRFGMWNLLGKALGNRGVCARRAGRPLTAAAHQAEAARVLSACGDRAAASIAHAGRGLALMDSGRVMAARAALRIARAVDSGGGVLARVETALAVTDGWLGRERSARRRLARALREARRSRDVGALAEALATVVEVTRARGCAIRRAARWARLAGEPVRERLRIAILHGLRDDPRRAHRVARRLVSAGSEAAVAWLALATIDSGEFATLWGRGYRDARARNDDRALLCLEFDAVVHLLRHGRDLAAARRWRRAMRRALDLEESMSTRQRRIASRVLLGDRPERVLQAVEDRLLELGRDGSAAVSTERRELLDGIAALSRAETVDGALSAFLDALLRLTRAERVVIVERDGDGLVVTASRSSEGTPVENAATLSTTIVHEALASNRSLVIADARTDPEWSRMVSVAAGNLHAVACVPMRARGRSIGAVYLDGGIEEGVFDASELPVMEAFAELATIAIENLRDRDRTRQSFHRQLQTQRSLAAAHAREAQRLRAGRGEDRLVGRSAAFRAADELVTRAARSEVPVLLRGESGTGKELFARAVHDRSNRREGPWVVESCANLPGELIEAEMFGYERGAFTGAETARPGLFQAAAGGTLFLDEIAELPLDLQPRLLRALQEKRVRPLGSRTEVEVDFRLVTATHEDLAARVKAGEFREDLYYRIKGIEIEIPSLRQRKEDVGLLVARFLEGTGKRVSEEALRLLEAASWPGNVRQLSNEVRRACLLADGEFIEPEHLSDSLRGDERPDPAGARPELPLKLADWERWALEHALRTAGGSRKRAAILLGVSRSTLYKMLERHAAG